MPGRPVAAQASSIAFVKPAGACASTLKQPLGARAVVVDALRNWGSPASVFGADAREAYINAEGKGL